MRSPRPVAILNGTFVGLLVAALPHFDVFCPAKWFLSRMWHRLVQSCRGGSRRRALGDAYGKYGRLSGAEDGQGDLHEVEAVLGADRD